MKTVLITGAKGNIGQKLREISKRPGNTLRSLCLNPGNDPAVHTADLHLRSRPGRRVRWCRYSAAHRRIQPRASWARIQSRNIGLMLNVLPAAQQYHVRRVVFASSYFVVAVQRCSAGALTTTMEPALINPYDASKLFSARVGKMFSERYGVSFIALRMGVCQRANGKFASGVDSLRPLAARRCGSAAVICAAPSNTWSTMNASASVSTIWFRITPACGGRSLCWRVTSTSFHRDGEKMRVAYGAAREAGLAWVREVGLRKFGDRLA